jgi:protein-S-isoprenylcysteine O-methyltransferase Ste14
MRIWLLILVVWVSYLTAGGSQDDVNIPWLFTVGCWACLDFCWAFAPRGAMPAAGVRPQRLGPSLLAMLPHLLYCLPLSGVPVLGQRLIPRMPALETAGAVMCTAGVGFATWARHVLAKNWSGGVAPTPDHTLTRRGPYAIVRHPIYLGLLVAQAGMMLALGEARVLVLVFGMDRLLRKVAQEDAVLRTAYPTEYERYAGRVKRLVPWIW